MTTTFADRGEITTLVERVAAGVGRVDREGGVIRGVRILGRVSKNGREYLPEAIRGAVGLYEGIRVNCDHPSSARGDRSIADRIGWLAGVHESDGGLRGNLHLILAHPFTSAVLEMAERNPSMLGLSHNAEGRIVKRDGKNIVEEITAVRSVDLVADPATADSLFEGFAFSQPMDSAGFAKRLLEDVDGGGVPGEFDGKPSPYEEQIADAIRSVALNREIPAAKRAKMIDQLGGLLDDIRDRAIDVPGQIERILSDVPGMGSDAFSSPAAESYDAASFASQLTEGRSGGSCRPSTGRSSGASFAAALLG